ncbi:hypothetical protein JR316_0006017 [Psilocybe cubensis]|uniref:Uncharacterized protein n=2 Tax=Psilocybe cubensis TaxID=181762 RepID=A0ACB8H2S0_PSICU|nr:hypothetical protein JR316_0006017 [Psilocybe cubensis]KAH9481490.1 hypothetical protein JR316_0006017 [Psilocybe cubensis]
MSSQTDTSGQRVFRPLPRVDRTREHTASEASQVTVESLGDSFDTLGIDDTISETTYYSERERPPTYYSTWATDVPVCAWVHLGNVFLSDSIVDVQEDSQFSTSRRPGAGYPHPDIGQSLTVLSNDHGNQSGNTVTGSADATAITSLGYVPTANSEHDQPGIYTSFVHTPTQAIPRERESNTMILSPVRRQNYDTAPINTSLSLGQTPSRSTLSFSLTGSKSYTKYISKMNNMNIPLTGKPLAYMQSNILDQQDHFPLWMQALATNLQPGDVGIFKEEGAFQSFFNISLTWQQNCERFGKAPPSGFKPFGNITVHSSLCGLGFMNRTEGFESFDRTFETYGSHSRARFEFQLIPSQCDEVEAALIFPDPLDHCKENYASDLFNELRQETGVDYLKAQIDNWYEHISSKISKDVKSTHLILIERTYTAIGPCGQVLYRRPRNKKAIQRSNPIQAVFEPRLRTDAQGQQWYEYEWSVVGNGSGKVWLRDRRSGGQGMGGPEEKYCIGISALTLTKKKKLF